MNTNSDSTLGQNHDCHLLLYQRIATYKTNNNRVFMAPKTYYCVPLCRLEQGESSIYTLTEAPVELNKQHSRDCHLLLYQLVS